MDLPMAAAFTGGGALLSAAVAGLWAHLTKRVEVTRSSPAAQTTADASFVAAAGEAAKAFGEAAAKMLGPVQGELDTMRTRFDQQAARHTAEMDEIRGELRLCHEGHRACEQKYADLEKRFLISKLGEEPPPYLPGLEPRF